MAQHLYCQEWLHTQNEQKCFITINLLTVGADQDLLIRKKKTRKCSLQHQVIRQCGFKGIDLLSFVFQANSFLAVVNQNLIGLSARKGVLVF